MDTVEGTDQPPQRNIEIFHFGEYDAIVNRKHPDQEQINSLLNTVRGGIPKTWIRTKMTTDENVAEIYQDSPTNPTFAAKVRGWIMKPTEFKETTNQIKDDGYRRETYAKHSLAKELELAETVRQLLQTEEAQELAREYEFDSIRYVEPLLGIIERSTGVKTMFYKWQEGQSYFVESDDLTDEYDTSYTNREGLASELYDYFDRHNIEANDLNRDQFIIKRDGDGRKHVYLIDTEGYVRKS